MHLTPALGQLLLTAGKKTLPSIRWVLFGGDVLTWREIAQIRQLAPNAKIGSFYGATETQRAVGYFQIPDEFPSNADRAVPLGRGTKDVQLLLLNKNGQLTGIGELGELYVRSPHLATGYIGDEKRTQEMFVINPFTNDAKDRMYKTGEIGRYLPDGNVEWAGRNDRRVNIRGFRVELEEVEAVLKQHAAVQNAAVVLRDFELPKSETPLVQDSDNLKSKIENPKSDRRLVAYVVAEEEQQSLVDLLHSYVSTRLPDYMVPSYFVVLDRLPLSPNGKVDYKALPPVEQSLTGQTDSFVAPRNDFEAKLCEIFSNVLGIEQVGVNDNFFRLGGHSLLAAQAAARIKETFGVALELRTFLESPTVAALAKSIEIRIEAAYTPSNRQYGSRGDRAMSIAEFVSHLRNLDVRLSAEGQRLRLNAPKGVLTDSLRAQIAERKQELLQFLSDYDQPAAFTPPPILRRTSSDPAPLSFAQERLWFLEQLESGSAVYNICRASRLTGQLNIAALESSLSEIVRRHEILRSQIRIVDGRPVQVAVAVSRFELPVTDLRSFTETEREREVRDRIKAEAEWQFDFSAGLFLRAVLLQISNDQHILILTTHHIVADAWSMGILTRELWTLYDALANERTSPLQELAVQYADYAVWQREWLQGDVLESQLSYWKEQLKELPILNLPTDHPRPVKQSFRGARQPLSLPESLTTAVNELSRREGVTQFMTLLAAFQVLLYRYSGQEDVVVGSPIANRNRTES